MPARFGLNADPIFVPPAGVNTYAGFNNLISFVGQPEGLLLRRITAVKDALDFGGIILVQGTSWIFYVGKTLVEALAQNKLGMYSDVASGQVINFTRVESMDGFTQDATGAQSTTKGGRSMTTWEERPFFNPVTGPIYAYGVVTSATEGYGYDSAPASTMWSGNAGVHSVNQPMSGTSYVSTVCPMDTTFEAFMSTVLTRALSLVPSNVRQYYVTTYDAAMASFPGRLVKPSIGVNTHWSGINIATTRGRFKHANVGAPQVMPANEASMPTVWSATSQLPAGTVYPVYNYTPVYFRGNRCGHFPFRSPGLLFPPMGAAADGNSCFTLVNTVGFGAGTLGGLQIGMIRDAQVLLRSVMLGNRYAEAPAGFSNLAEYVMSQTDTTGTTVSRSFNPEQLKGNNAAIIAAVSGENAWGQQNSVFARGNISTLLDAFDSHWNEKALQAASA